MPVAVVHIAFPILCWSLLLMSLNGIWLDRTWMVAVTAAYYGLAAVYIVFMVITRVKVYAIAGLFLVLAASLFMWIPYHWILAVLMVPVLFMAFFNRGIKITGAVLTVWAAVSMVFVIHIALICNGLAPEKFACHPSPDGNYIAFEHEYRWLFFGGTDVLLCRVSGPLLVKERVLYLANHEDFGGNIEWLDQNTILIYGEKMDPFTDPVIENYDPF